MTIPLPVEMVLYPLLAFLIYSVSLKGEMIFDDIMVIPAAKDYQFRWSRLKTGRVLGCWLLALQMRWPGTLRGVHSMNCWIHAVNAFLVEQMARSLGCDPVQAFTAGLFFVVMPFAANTVSYMSGQFNLLSATFGLLGCLAILTGYGFLSLPCLLLSYLAKEDGLGFAASFLFLSAWQAQWWVAGVLVMALASATVHQWKWLRHLALEAGDDQMASIGLPVSYPQPRHGLTVLFATLWRLPAWFFGLKQSPYHGSGLKK